MLRKMDHDRLFGCSTQFDSEVHFSSAPFFFPFGQRATGTARCMTVDDTTRALALHDCGSVLAHVVRATTQAAPRNHDDHYGRTEHHLT